MNNPKVFRDFITPENVAHARYIAGLKQEEAATAVGRQVQTWCLWEGGRNRMPYRTFESFIVDTALLTKDTEIVWAETGEILGILSHETLAHVEINATAALAVCAFRRRCREKANNNPFLQWKVCVKRSHSRDAYDFLEAWREARHETHLVIS